MKNMGNEAQQKTDQPTDEFSGVSRFSVRSLSETYEEPIGQSGTWPCPIGSAYLDLNELVQALDLYYAGQLNNVEPENCWRPLRNLVPSSTLISQITQEDMANALDNLGLEETQALRREFERVNEQPSSSAQREGSDSKTYASALGNLAKLLLLIL